MTASNAAHAVKHPAEGAGPLEAIQLAAEVARWHVPVLTGGDASLPYMALEGDEPVALFFTTRRRAYKAIDGWIADVSDGDVRSRAIDRDTALSVLGRLHARGLQWIRIDHGPRSIRLPLEPLLGAMQKAWECQAALGLEASAWAWLARQERVLLLRDPIAEDLPLVEIQDDKPAIRLFVNRRRAEARAMRLSIDAGEDQRSQVLPMRGDLAVECLKRLAHLGVEQVILEQPGGARSLPLGDLLMQARKAA